jgi:Na+/H+ antiporter NhaC
MHIHIIQSTPHQGFSVTDYIKYHAYLYYLLILDYLYLYNHYDITFLFILTHPVNLMDLKSKC